MAWTTPTVRAYGYLVTASDWNTDIVDNLAFLKGEAGIDIDFEDDIIGKAGTERCGLSTKPWDEGHFDDLFAGPRCRISKNIREVVITWEDDTLASYQIAQATTGGGAVQLGGTGQAVLKVDEDVVGTAYVGNEAEQNSALDTSFNASRTPYLRIEFSCNNADPALETFIGFRTTLGAARPLPAAESYVGIMWQGTNWLFETGDGAGNQNTSGSQTVANNQRHVVEFYFTGAAVECYLDGAWAFTASANLPSGDLDWTGLAISDGSGGAGLDVRVTIGQVRIQESLS